MTSRNTKKAWADERQAEKRRAGIRKGGASRVPMAVARAIAKGIIPPEAPRVVAEPGRPIAGGAARASPAANVLGGTANPRVGTRRASTRSDQKRIAELKEKLHDEDYMNGAILRIATVLSARLTLR